MYSALFTVEFNVDQTQEVHFVPIPLPSNINSGDSEAHKKNL